MTRRRALRITCLVLIAIFYILSIPWYREPDQPLRIWMGLPDWVAVALLCYVGVAILNAIAWTLLDVSDSDSEAEAESNLSESPSRPGRGGEATR